MHEFVTELTAFCSEIVEVVNIDDSVEDALAKMKSAEAKETGVEGVQQQFKKSIVLVGTPGNFVKFMQKKNQVPLKYHSLVLDKIDLLQAMDFKDELVEIGDTLKDQVNGKFIFTTNVRDEKDLSVEEQDDFQTIKTAVMGTEKALIIRMND